jgi:hypothetical protein
MQPKNRDWIAALSGVGFVVLGILSFIVGGEPKSADHPAREVVAFYVDNKDSVQIGAFLGVPATALLVFFGGYLRRLLRAAAGEGEMLSLISFVGTVIVAVGLAIDTTILIALSESADDIDPTAVQALQALWDNDFVPLALGVLLFLWSTGLSVIRTGVLPKWLGWVMIALGVIGFTPIGFVSAVGAAILVLALSIMLTLRARSPSVATPAG